MRILVITEYIAPVNAIGSLRWTKLGKYLNLENGCIVDVLTNQKDFTNTKQNLPQYKYDENLSKELCFFNQIIEIHEPILSKIINTIFNKYSSLKTHQAALSNYKNINKKPIDINLQQKSTNHFFSNTKTTLGDIYRKMKSYPRISKALSENINWQNYDVVISSYGPKWVHLLGEQIKKRFPQIIWIADYRDELVYSVHTNTHENRTFPARHTSLADCITFATEKFENLMLPEGQMRVTLHNGFDKREIKNRHRIATNKFYISTTGTLYNDGTNCSDLKPLFMCLNELILERKIRPETVEVLYCGQSSEFFIQQIKDFRNISWEDLGMVSRSKALETQDKSSILVLPLWNTSASQGAVSGRIYEYLSSGVPMLSLCSGDVPNSKLKLITESAGVGFCYEEACSEIHYPQMKDFILKKYQEWNTSGMSECNSNWDYIQTFEYSHIAGELYKLLNNIKEKHYKKNNL